MRHRCSLFILLAAIGLPGAGWAGDGGRAVAQEQALEPRRGPSRVVDDPLPLAFEVHYLYRAGGRGPLEPLVEGAVLHSGDHYKIMFTPEEDSYVYIFQMDSTNKVYRLFPMHSFKGVVVDNWNPVRAGRTYWLPAADKAFQLDEQRGRETIYFMAFRSRQAQFEPAAGQPGSLPEAPVETLAAELRTRGPARIVQDLQEQAVVKWMPDESFRVPMQHLDMCDNCISTVKFEHR